MADIKKRFEVHPYEGNDVDDKGKVTRTHYKWDEEARKMDPYEVEEDAGYMLYTPSGTSVRIRDEKELKRQGFDRSAPLIDMDTGDIVGPSDTSLKTHSERVAHRSRPKKFEASLATKED